MKIFTAKEAREMHNKGIDPDKIDEAVRVINTGIKARIKFGESGQQAFIGKTHPEFQAIRYLKSAERMELLDALRNAGYEVAENSEKPFFNLSWKNDPEEED